MRDFCGWIRDEGEVEKVWAAMPTPFFDAPSPEEKDVHNHLIFRDVVGQWHDEGPQAIGDCTSWGNGRLVDYTQVLEQAYGTAELIDGQPAVFEFQQTCTEVIYALSRVDVGGGRMRGDGSVGAWVAKALTDFGSTSRKQLSSIGVSGDYSGARAREWGSRGVPENVKSLAKQHLIADMTPVRTFKDFAWHCQQGRVTAVCSDVGFENGSGNLTQRDSQGFATPRGTWPHCMALVSVRMGSRPGGLLTNQWPKGCVVGPMGDVEIPPCSWWVDAHVIDGMLGQGDSFTGTKYHGYPARKLTWKF